MRIAGAERAPPRRADKNTKEAVKKMAAKIAPSDFVQAAKAMGTAADMKAVFSGTRLEGKVAMTTAARK